MKLLFFIFALLVFVPSASACMDPFGNYDEAEAKIYTNLAAYIGRTRVLNIKKLDLDKDGDGIHDVPGELLGPDVTFELLDLPKDVDRLTQNIITVRFSGVGCERSDDFAVRKDVFFLVSGRWRRANLREYFVIKTYLEKQGQKDW